MARNTLYGSIPPAWEDSSRSSADIGHQPYFGLRHRWYYICGATLAAIVTLGISNSVHSPFGSSSSSYPLYGSSHSLAINEDQAIPSLSKASPSSLGLIKVKRDDGASPSKLWGDLHSDGTPIPTNSWYLNLLSHKAAKQPDLTTHVYTIPYIIDTASEFKGGGIRVHWPIVRASTRNVQAVYDYKNGISLGTQEWKKRSNYTVVQPLSPLGVTLKWNNNHGDKAMSMTSYIVRGMPYATMQYVGGVQPALHSFNAPATPPMIDDGTRNLTCSIVGDDDEEATTTPEFVKVEKEIQMHFRNSDFTWSVFFSRPVKVGCMLSSNDKDTAEFRLSVQEYTTTDTKKDQPLTVRLALLDQCTTGKADIKQHCAEKMDLKDWKEYVKLLRNNAHVYPTSPKFGYDMPGSSQNNEANMVFDWQAQTFEGRDGKSAAENNLIMFALPHHQDNMHQQKETSLSNTADVTNICLPTFHGKTCLVKGQKWSFKEDLGHRPLSFYARRPPEADMIPALASAIAEDIHYRLSDNLLRGAADTYFSGKFLARVARVIVIAKELEELASSSSLKQLQELYEGEVDSESLASSIKAASRVSLPSEPEIANALEQLKRGVQIWLAGNQAEAQYVYDQSWGGLVNCGCRYSGKNEYGFCNNTYPDCPALADVNEDFGNGFYNDHHYHYGYHMYAAAVVAKYDPSWGIENFDKVLLYVRDFANPSAADLYFPQFRQKDWFLGSSWASGIVTAENSPHGMNQESSSEAIAAYEGVTRFGAAMVNAFEKKSGSNYKQKLQTAKLVRDAGRLLMTTEVKAASRYYHVWSSDSHAKTWPAAYQEPTVGMLYETMMEFQTWFAPEDVVSYGIQLIPFTPVGEMRDDPEWAKILYPLYDKSCQSFKKFCVDNGWSIVQANLLATAGERKEALQKALAIPSKVFGSLGGGGNSLSNTIWYIATRKPLEGLR